MDKLSEHAIRMLEIADANDIPMIGNKQFQDIARAVYDIILQVQMLKMADRKTEPSDSEKPNNCETCKHRDKPFDELPCDMCCKANSGYEPKTEPQTDCAWGKGEE